MGREYGVIYKGVTIKCYHGSNYVYVNDRPFSSMRSCKIWITKLEVRGMLDSVIAKQQPRPQLIINQSSPYEYTPRVHGHLRAV